MSCVSGSHRIRRTRPGVVSGRHFFLNQWPELQGTDNYINSVNHEDMAESKTMCLFKQSIPIAKMMTCTIYAMK